jgi:DHA1 family bicyclomycin/chloramphenicol resistance-like MFS transporter
LPLAIGGCGLLSILLYVLAGRCHTVTRSVSELGAVK